MKFPLLSAWALLALAGSLPTATYASAGTLTSSGPSNVTSVRFCPRTGFAPRMLGGQFQGSFNKITWSVIASISTVPVENHWSSLTIDSHRNRMAFRYLRYMPPAGSYGNIAELEFDGGMNRTKLNGIAFGVPGSYGNGGDDFSKAFDGNLDTFYDSVKPSGGFVGIDLSVMRVPSPPQPPVRMLPAAPVGLTATSQFTTNCAKTGGIAMPHIALSWKSETGASYYTVYRNGAAVQVGVIPCAWTDMDITSGQTYSYALSATGPGGEGSRCAPISVTAPAPQISTLLTPPANLCIAGLWVGSTANVLSWQPVPGAAGYNVYVSDVRVGSGLTVPNFTLMPNMLWGGALFTVTTVDSQGMESIPSAPAAVLGVPDPALPANWWACAPEVPSALSVVPQWNQGSPRNFITWHGHTSDTVYNVIRDGRKVASGLSNLYYFDSDIKSGESHSYTVSGVNTEWPVPVEGTLSASVSITALDSPPAMATSEKISITNVIANDDSAVIFISPVPGATDYRVYDIHNPARAKYAGQITHQKTGYIDMPRMALSIEWNGINPAVGADLMVEAVDKLGPFQRMDGVIGSGAMKMSGMSGQAMNGQGDPSSVPIVLAQSAPFHVTCTPTVLSGEQAFFDNFRTSQPFVKQPLPSYIPPGSQFYGQATDYAAYDNDKWEVRQYGADLTNSQFFVMDNHFMDTTYDGGGPGSSYATHNNNASMVMMPKATADISGGKVLHITFEADAHFSSRRWLEVGIGEAGAELINIAKFQDQRAHPTVGGKFLRWQIEEGTNNLDLFPALGGAFSQVDLMQFSDWNDEQTTSRICWDHTAPLANGTPQDLDKRHKFDLYVSKTHYRLQETMPGGMYNTVRERDFPAGSSLPFDKCQVYFVHQVYHTGNDIHELKDYRPEEQYWYNQRAFADERHWDNMGFEVLNSFPG